MAVHLWQSSMLAFAVHNSRPDAMPDCISDTLDTALRSDKSLFRFVLETVTEPDPWASRCSTWLLIELMPKVFSVLTNRARSAF